MTHKPMAAFTLLELLLYAAIIGIISGMGIATFSHYWPNEQLKSASRITVAWLEDARRLSLQQDSNCIIEIKSSELTLDQAVDNPVRCNGISKLQLRQEISNSETLKLCTQALNSTSNCSATQNNSAIINFTPRGTSNTTVQLRYFMASRAEDRCIAIIAPLGLIRSGKARHNNTCNYTESH